MSMRNVEESSEIQNCYSMLLFRHSQTNFQPPRKNLSTMKNWVIYIFHHTENDWMKIYGICVSDGIKMLIKIYTKMHFIQIDSERCGGGIMVIFEMKLVARVRSGEDNLDES